MQIFHTYCVMDMKAKGSGGFANLAIGDNGDQKRHQ